MAIMAYALVSLANTPTSLLFSNCVRVAIVELSDAAGVAVYCLKW
jgi:hypothetical protein